MHLQLRVSVVCATLMIVFVWHRRILRKWTAALSRVTTIDEKKPGSDLFDRLRTVGRIALPSLWSREFSWSIVFIALFWMNSVISVKRLQADGAVLEAFVCRSRRKGDLISTAVWAYISYAIGGAIVSGCIEHLRHYLISAYRARLTEHFHKKFFHKLTFYHATVLDDRIEAANVAITSYCAEFAEHFAELPYYFVMPLFSAVVTLVAVARSIGRRPTAVLVGTVLASISLLKYLSPSFGKIHAALLQREEAFRSLHGDARANVEQIAMYGAGEFTHHRLSAAYQRVRSSAEHMALAKGHFQMLETAVSSAIWDVVAVMVCSAPFRFFQRASGYYSQIGAVVVQRRLITDFHTSVKAFIVNFKEISHLTEFTERLSDFDAVLDSVAKGEFVKKPDPKFLMDGDYRPPTKEEYLVSQYGHATIAPVATKEDSAIVPPQNESVQPPTHLDASALSSNLSQAAKSLAWLVRFNDVTVATPNGIVLIEHLTFDLHLGDRVVVTGPNGCGKSSLLRVLAGMWRPLRGCIQTHPRMKLFCLPQCAYMLTNSTFVDQLFFPLKPPFLPSSAPRHANVRGLVPRLGEEHIRQIKAAVENATAIQIIDEVLGGWEGPLVGLFEPISTDGEEAETRPFDWYSLSGGQQQKVALARLFLHAFAAKKRGEMPLAVMDESTSQMDHAAEEAVFSTFVSEGITLLSVSHRQTVIARHDLKIELTQSAQHWTITSTTGA